MHRGIKRLLAGTFALGAVATGLVATGATTATAADVTLKLHHFLPPVSPGQKLMLEPWAEKVAKDSGGKIKVEIYPSMQLGGVPPQLVGQVRDGVVDLVWTLPGYTPGQFVMSEVFELPFLHKDTVSTNKALWEFVEKHPEEYKDFKLIALHSHAGQLFHSKKAIRAADDLKGLKIRTPTRTGGWLIEAMGAAPVGAPVPKIPELLSKGVVDVVLIPYEITASLKVHEMVDFHVTLDDPKYPRINTSTFMIAMNKAKYESLPADLKKVIDANSGMANAEWIGKVWNEIEVPGEKLAGESGELIKLAPAEVAKLRAMTEQPVAERWIAEVAKRNVDGKALLAEAKALIDKHSK